MRRVHAVLFISLLQGVFHHASNAWIPHGSPLAENLVVRLSVHHIPSQNLS